LGAAGPPLRWRAAAIDPLPNRFWIAGRHAQAVADEGFVQRRPGGAQLGRSRVDTAQPLGQGKRALGLGPVDQEPAGLPAQRIAIVPAPLLCSALSYERVLSVANVEQYATTVRMRLRPAI
jgi:hypothetical protein